MGLGTPMEVRGVGVLASRGQCLGSSGFTFPVQALRPSVPRPPSLDQKEV